MAQAGNGRRGVGAQLAARLIALQGVAPAPVRHVIFRSTGRIDGTRAEGYLVPDNPALLDTVAMDAWLARQPVAVDRLAVAVLVIRERLDMRGLIQQCTIERRRGAADGPFCGAPARVDFAGGAGAMRIYRSHPDGRLTEAAPSADTGAPRMRPPEHFAGEQQALQRRFGDGIQVFDAREPTLFEEMIGLASIVHVRTLDGSEIGCGIGWHGEMAYLLEADFPRFGASLDLPKEDAEAVAAAVAANDLVCGNPRRDEHGVAVVGRRRASEELCLLRPVAGTVRVEPHSLGRRAARPEQARWIRYVESYESLTVLDVWHDGVSDDIIALSGDASGRLWRHHVDADGVETWRKADEDAAIGGLLRDRLFADTLVGEELEPPDNDDDAPGDADSTTGADALLAVVETYQRAMATLRDARLAADRDAALLAGHVQMLREALGELATHASAAARADGLILSRLAEELPGCEQSPAAYDLDEAARCLALGRSTAAVFHCMRAVERGIEILTLRAGIANPLAVGDRDWRSILGAAGAMGDTGALLHDVRAWWRGGALAPANRHTEEEAENILRSVKAFIRTLDDAPASRQS